jgi:hypothetical protein
VARSALDRRGIAQEALDDAVLEAVEADDGKPPPLAQQRFRGRQRSLQLVELGVHVDADSLEAAGGGILGSAGPVAEGLAHDASQVAGRLERAGGDNRAGDPAALALLAVGVEDVGDRALVRLVQEVRGARPVLAHAHVERALGGKREPAPRLVELHR